MQWLDDTVVVARVGKKTIRVRDYVERFFNSYMEYRPSTDSLGRVEFLQRMIHKEVLASVARAANYQETFEERAQMKSYTQRVLSNILFERAIKDSVQVTDAEAESVYVQMKRELHLARVRFGSQATAERIRGDLESGRMSWARAWDLRLRIPGDNLPNSDTGWQRWTDQPTAMARAVFGLPVGAVSAPVAEPPGFSLYLVKEERPARIQPFIMFRGAILDNLRQEKTDEYRERLVSGVREGAGIQFDSANVAFAAASFPSKVTGEGTARVVLDTSVPSFSPADTGRTVATYRGGKVTVRRVVDGYREIPDVMRPSLDTPEGIRQMVDVIVLEPKLADLARQRGYDRDSEAVTLIAMKREETMVDRLYGDSIEAKVFIPPAARRKYYQEHQYRFVTPPNARYAVFHLDKASADSMAAGLRRGTRAEDIIRTDSIAGLARGRIETKRRDDSDNPFYKQVFSDMKVGEISSVGPDQAGSYDVLQLLERDSGRPVPFEEADSQIDEYLQQEASEKLLDAFIVRHSKKMKIDSHPELLMRIRLVQPF